MSRGMVVLRRPFPAGAAFAPAPAGLPALLAPAPVVVRGRRLGIGSWLVLAAALMNIALCFIKTRHWVPVMNPEIAGCELIILFVGIVAVRTRVGAGTVLLGGFAIAFEIGMKLINPGLDLKILHDLAIPVIFFALGRRAGVAEAHRLSWALMAVVLAVGGFELLFTDLFGRVFDVWSYYVDKGVIAQGTVNYSGTNLFLSGERGAASRNFLPSVFGSHRVSSVFLEPDSLGNYAAVMFAWCLCAPFRTGTARTVLAALCCLCFVLADSRFAAGCCLCMLLLRLSPPCRSRFVVLVLPCLVMLGLLIAGSARQLPGVVPAIQHDDLSGRLLFSGRLLDYWHLPQWLALAKSQVYVADTGYAYVVNNLGLPLAVGLLALFAAYPAGTPRAAAMKVLISVYLATSLCVGASIFTIKTAALLWFLLGALDGAEVAPGGAGRRMAARPAAAGGWA